MDKVGDIAIGYSSSSSSSFPDIRYSGRPRRRRARHHDPRAKGLLFAGHRRAQKWRG